MIYYLETNALNNFSQNKIIPKLLQNSFTSYLSLLEIASGIDRKSYDRRRKILKKTIDSKVKIDWRMPQDVIASSFGISGFQNDYRVRMLKNTINLIIDISDYNQLLEIVSKRKNSNRYFSIIDLNKADSEICNPDIAFYQRVVKGVTDNKIVSIDYIKTMRAMLPKERDDITTDEYLIINDIITKLKNIKVRNYAEAIYRTFKLDCDKSISIDELVLKYNNRIDFYLFLDSYRIIRDCIMCSQPAINDTWDNSHLLYIDNWEKILVTNDNKLFADVYFLYPKSVKKIEEIQR